MFGYYYEEQEEEIEEIEDLLADYKDMNEENQQRIGIQTEKSGDEDKNIFKIKKIENEDDSDFDDDLSDYDKEEELYEIQVFLDLISTKVKTLDEVAYYKSVINKLYVQDPSGLEQIKNGLNEKQQ